MRRSSRLETATAEKRKTKMSTRLAEHAKRQRREMARADGDDEPEEGEEVDGGDDSDFIASSEEEEEEEGEDEEDEDLRPRRLNRKRRAAPSSVSTDSAESDNSAESVKKIKSILKKQSEIASEKKPKSILKRPKTHSADSSPNGKVEPKSAADANEGHRRPVKQRSVDAIGSGSSTERKGFIGSISRTRTSIGNTLTQFFNEILEWDFHDALMRQAHKDFAVVTAANDGSEEGEVEVTRVPSKFDSYEHYFSVWKPLALEEVQAQTLNSVFTDRPVAIPLEAAAQGSNFLDRTVKIRIDAKKTGVPATQRMVRKNFDNLYVQDLVLFTPNQSYFTRAFQVHSNGGNADTKPVTESDKEGFLGILATKGGPREGVTVTVLSNDWRQYESRKSELFGFKLTSLVTSVREFRALCDCEGYRLLPLLLSGEHVAGSMQLDSLGLGYVRWLRSAFNESQLEAITAAATSEGFTLIKGPPGTGKTTTLKGLLNSIHLREYNRYYNAVLDVARRPDHETNQAWARIGNEKPHILVTAPSNAAVDNIIGKIISEGFCDGEGRKYFPKIVRVGRGMSSNVRVVGLDDMVDTVCEKSYDELQQKLISLRTEIAKVENDSMHIRNNLRHLVAAIDRDPVGFLAREAQQMQLQQQQQQQQQQHQEQVHVQKPDQPASPLSPPPVESMDSPPPPGIQLSPSASSPPPPLSIGSPPPNMAMYPSSPPAYALSTSSPPAPHSPVYGGSTVPYTFADDQDEGEEEDEAFPPLLVDPPAPEISVKTEPELKKHSNQTESRSELVESAGSPEPAHNGNSSRRIEDDIKMDPLSVVVDDIKTEPLRVVIVHPTEPTEPMSPPPPPPMSPPPPPPMSPPPPSPPASPTVKSETVDDAVNASDEVPSPSAFQGPIIYEKYFQYRVVAQQLNACLERLSELRLEENRYYAARNGVNEKGRASSQLRQSLEVSILDTAHIVFTTLSSAGVTALNDSAKYDVLVVDEAAQAVELSSIIPMKFGSRQCVLVGDPQQLSATVFSRTSGVSLYERSLFERLETTGHPVHMLRTQYRSHPLISDFPRHYFYDGKLQDADSVKTPVYDRPYHRLGAGAFTPLVFWNLLSSRETTRSVSRLNVGEAEMAVNLYLTLKNSCPPDAVPGKVGVITPYSQQMDELRNRFRRALGERYDTEVEINTVDGFQGREKDIILLSTVRADPKAGVGFLNDTRRMNVALTRAKFACYVIGSEITLRSSRPWAALMDHARKHECIVHVQDPNCNLLTLRPMEMPPGAQPPQGVGAQWRGGSKKGFQHPPHPHVQIPNQPPDHFSHHQPSSQFPTSGPHPGRRPSPTGAPPNYGQERGPSPTNQAWRGGRGRGGGRDARRDPRLNGRGGRGGGRGGRGSSFNGGRGGFDAGGPPGPTYQGPGPQQAYVQQHQGLPNGNFGPPPIQHEGPTNGNFGPPPGQQQGPPNGSFGPPPAQYQGPPNGNFGPPAHSSFPPRQFGGGPPYPTQGYPAPASQHMMPAQPAFQGPPAPSHFQQQQHAPPPHQYQGPPPSAGFAGPPPQQQLPPPQYHDGGQGASHAGRIRDPRLLRQQGRGGRSYGQ